MSSWERTGQLWARTARADAQGTDLPIQLTGAGGALPERWLQMVGWQAPADALPEPVCVQVEIGGVDTGDAAEGAPPVPQLGGWAPVRACPPGWADWPRRGLLLVEYAGFGGWSRRWLDPRSGTYSLPPSRAVSVSALAYRDAQATWLPWTLTVGLAPGKLEHPAQPVYSGVLAVAGAFASRTWWPPRGARDVRLGLDPAAGSDAVATIRGTQPGQQVGPTAYDQTAPPADLAPVSAQCEVDVAATAGTAAVYVETGLQW